MKKHFILWIERFALWLLATIGTEIITISAVMVPYMDEVRELCLIEEPIQYGSTDIHGDGYFKSRRVIQMMLKAHPELQDYRRDLTKAVVCAADTVKGQTP